MASVEIPLGVVSTEDRWFFRAVQDEPSHQPVRLLAPYGWVARSALYLDLPEILAPAALVRLDARRGNYPEYPALEKCFAEALFERVRRRVAPAAPSRLSCTFAAPDAASAMKFAIDWFPEPSFDEHGFADVHAIPVRTAGSPWIALDMNLFYVPERIGPSERGNAYALAMATRRAYRYWTGKRSSGPAFIEILAESLAF